eukprot:571010-Alexandrium_andersonii.AAC.1
MKAEKKWALPPWPQHPPHSQPALGQPVRANSKGTTPLQALAARCKRFKHLKRFKPLLALPLR